MAALFGAPQRAGSEEWNSTRGGVELHASPAASLQVGAGAAGNSYLFTEGEADQSAILPKQAGAGRKSGEEVARRSHNEPLTDEDIRRLGFEPTAWGWVPRR
jgi:hypothetical protein